MDAPDLWIGPYRVVRRLGAGGMGEVFLAEDSRLSRLVAIKRPNAEALARTDARERLRREARAAAQLNHPNVAAIYDVVDADGIPHIVMEHVEGTNLAQLARGGPLPAEQVITIGRQIAGALHAAHVRGIVHRDLKPGNVMLTAGGDVKVLDFGLARVAEAAHVAGGASMTPSSHVYGTPGYMAPEQFVGQPTDARSDIFSCGAVLYELLTGAPPFKGTDAIERAIAAHRGERAPRPQAMNPVIPAALDDIVGRALEVNPAKRYQTAADLQSALGRAAGLLSEAPTVPSRRGMSPVTRRVFWPALAALSLSIATLVFTAERWATPAATKSTTVAVLPFSLAAGEQDLESIGIGLADLVARALSTTSGMTVVPRAETVPYRARKNDLARVVQELDVDRVVDGELRRTPSGIEATLRVVPGERQASWERVYSGTLDDVVTMGRRMLRDVAVELGAPEAPTDVIGVSEEALQQYSQARALLDRSDIPGNVDRAILLLSASTERQDRAETRAALGEAYYLKYRASRDRQWIDRAEQEVMQALRMKGDQPLVLLSYATILNATGKRQEAERELRTLIAQAPTDAAHRLLAQVKFEAGLFEAALAELQRAIALRPGYWQNHRAVASTAMRAGQFARAEEALTRVIELQPDQVGAYSARGTLHLLLGQFDRAVADFRQTLAMQPDATAWSNLGTALFELGSRADALEAFRRAVALRPRDPVLHRNLGDAFASLARAREARAAYAQGVRLAGEDLQVNETAPATHRVLAICLAKLGRFPEALAAARRAVDLAPGSPDSHLRHADVLALAGRPDPALDALSEAMRLGLHPAHVRLDHDLDSLRGLKRYRDLVTPLP